MLIPNVFARPITKPPGVLRVACTCQEEDESQRLSSGAAPSKRDPGRGTCPQKQARAALSDGSDLSGGWTCLGGGGGEVGKVGKEGRGPMEGRWPGGKSAVIIIKASQLLSIC